MQWFRTILADHLDLRTPTHITPFRIDGHFFYWSMSLDTLCGFYANNHISTQDIAPYLLTICSPNLCPAVTITEQFSVNSVGFRTNDDPSDANSLLSVCIPNIKAYVARGKLALVPRDTIAL